MTKGLLRSVVIAAMLTALWIDVTPLRFVVVP
jgi:hypothetical protein